jgi:hypothetical protein
LGEPLKKISLDKLKAIIAKTRPGISFTSEIFKTAVLLYASGIHGTDVKKLTLFTKLPLAFIKKQTQKFISMGMWDGPQVVSDWHDPASGIDLFWQDVESVCGLHPRVPEEIYKLYA